MFWVNTVGMPVTHVEVLTDNNVEYCRVVWDEKNEHLIAPVNRAQHIRDTLNQAATQEKIKAMGLGPTD